MGIIALEGMAFRAFHGFYDEERILGNDFLVDVYIQINFPKAASEDDLNGTINYQTVYEICKFAMREPARLLEALAYSISNALKFQFDEIQQLKIRIRKLNPPVGGIVGSSFVETDVSFMVSCGKCGNNLVCYSDENCWCKELSVAGRTLEALALQYKKCLCRKCLSDYASS
ncbi:MAG: dihydroneopterin aldolase [Saprospiraceae bacterium]